MGKVKRYKKTTWGVMSPLHATISTSWVPLTFALLLYTSGIDLSIGDSAAPSEDDATENGTAVKRNYNLTGNPQIDYIYDPNLPRELNGYNLSDYPFYSRVPSKINYSCEGLKDGFYSNIEHKCQVYHHCLYGARHDFLCANFTAFDQKTFICQFVSEVDCANSALFYHRNDALYPEKPTTPVPEPIKIRPGLYERRRPPPRDRHSAAAAAGAAAEGGGASQDPAPGVAPLEEEGVDPYYDSEEDYRPVRRKPLRRRCKNKRRCRRPSRRRPRPRPVYYDDYEDDYEDDYDSGYDDYYEDRPKQRGGRRKDKTGNKVAGSKVEESVVTRERGTTTTTTTASTTTTTTPSPEQVEQETIEVEQAKNREEILSKARPMRIRKYEFSPQGRSASPGERSTTTSTTPPPTQSSSTSPSVQEVGDDYYYDNEDGQQPAAAPPTAQPRTTSKPKPTVPTTQSLRQRFISRNFRQSPATTKGPISTTTTTTTSTPSTTTTPKPTTTASTTTNTTPRPQRVTLRSQTTTATTATTTTSTTTEAPQYEYEYEYEDEVSSSSQAPLAPTTQLTTSTTTPTPTLKPVRPLIRGNKRPQLGGTVQTSTSVSVQEQDGNNDDVDDSQNAINRRQSSWVRGQQSRTSPSSTITPASSPTPASTSVTSSTSERVSYQPQGRGNRQQQPSNNNYQEPTRESAPVITVKSQSPISPPPSQIPQYQLQNSGAKETPAIKNRPSRFWQRPTKVVASSSTTAEPPASLFSEYDYSDADEEESPAPAVTRFTQPSSNSRFKSTPALVPSSTSSYSDRETPSNSNSYRGQYTASTGNTNPAPQQYLRSTISQPNSYPTPSRSPPTQQNNFISQYGPSPSSIGIQYQHQLPSSTTSSSRPEFISLLRDDEDPYSPYETQQQDYPRSSSSSSSSSSSFTNSNNNRRIPAPARTQYFGGTGPSSSGGHFHNSQKHLYSAAQETYHSFLPAPSRFNFMNMGIPDFASGPGMVLYSRNPVMLSGKKK